MHSFLRMTCIFKREPIVLVGQPDDDRNFPSFKSLQSSPSLTSTIQEHCLQRNNLHIFLKYVHWQNFNSFLILLPKTEHAKSNRLLLQLLLNQDIKKLVKSYCKHLVNSNLSQFSTELCCFGSFSTVGTKSKLSESDFQFSVL